MDVVVVSSWGFGGTIEPMDEAWGIGDQGVSEGCAEGQARSEVGPGVCSSTGDAGRYPQKQLE